MHPAQVHLVGAGPGDPGLLTLKGARALAAAAVVVYDRLLDPSLLELAPPSARRVFVGKERGRQALSQSEINRLLVSEAQAGNVVVRLKGGDPFVFGRGGEEAQALAAAGIPFAVVPGVTSAVAAAAYAGIPVTHRGLSTAVTIVTGSEDPSKGPAAANWPALARSGGTLVALMGWAALPGIAAVLQDNGMPPDTPAALVQWGTWPGPAHRRRQSVQHRRTRPGRRHCRPGHHHHRRSRPPAGRNRLVRPPPPLGQTRAGNPLPHPSLPTGRTPRRTGRRTPLNSPPSPLRPWTTTPNSTPP